MLTGQKPFDGAAAMSVIIQHRDAPVPRLTGALLRFQPALERMLAKNPAQRFQSAGEVLDWRPEPLPVAAVSGERQ